MCEQLLTNPLIEDYEIQLVKFGVVRFPGSCDEVDALLAAQRVGEAELLWHADRDLRGVDAVIVPGGFSYGDYLRVGAIARFAPVMEEVERFARAGGPVLGICNGFQVLCEAGLLPGALLPNTSLRFLCRQVGLTVASTTGTAWTRACARGRARCRSPSSTRPAATTRPTRCSTSWRRNGQVVLRYAPGAEPQRLAARHRRRLQRGGQRRRADAAPRARGRPADRARPTG